MNIGVHVYFQAMFFSGYICFPGGSNGKESACNTGDVGSVPELGRSPGEGNSYPLQYSGLENSIDREAWWATVHGVAKSRILLCDFHFYFPLSYPGMGLQGHMIALFLVF